MAKVYFNGQIIDENQNAIKVSETGFLYGAGLFETMLVKNGVVFCLKYHLSRLMESASELSIACEYTGEQIQDAISQLLKENKLTDARVRLTITNGPLNVEKPDPTILISAAKLKPYPDTCYNKGVSVVLTNFRQNPADPLTGHKSTSYFTRLMALDQARKKKCTEALWFTIDNRLAEGSISNLFLVKESVLYTPPLDTPVLPGVARKNIIELAGECKIKVVEKNLFIQDLLEADEVFVSNVIMKIMPVTSVEKHAVADSKVGPVTKKLIEAYEELIRLNCDSGGGVED